MNSILELIFKLPSVTEVSIDCATKTPAVYTMQSVIHNLQLAFYWWSSAEAELEKETESVKISQDKGDTKIKYSAPSLLTPEEQLEYLDKELIKITEGACEYLDNVHLPYRVKQKVEQGYNKAMEALFNTKISILYYGELNRINQHRPQ